LKKKSTNLKFVILLPFPLCVCTLCEYTLFDKKKLRTGISTNFQVLDIPAIYFSPRLSRDRRSSIYTILIALPAAVHCYTIIWLNQSLPLIRSGISGGNYWNGCLSWKYLEWRFVLPKGLLNFVWRYCNFGCLTYAEVSLNHCAAYVSAFH